MSQQPDNELDDIIKDFGLDVSGKDFTKEHFLKYRQHLLAWRDKTVVDELNNVRWATKENSGARQEIDDRIAQLKGGSNE